MRHAGCCLPDWATSSPDSPHGRREVCGDLRPRALGLSADSKPGAGQLVTAPDGEHTCCRRTQRREGPQPTQAMRHSLQPRSISTTSHARVARSGKYLPPTVVLAPSADVEAMGAPHRPRQERTWWRARVGRPGRRAVWSRAVPRGSSAPATRAAPARTPPRRQAVAPCIPPSRRQRPGTAIGWGQACGCLGLRVDWRQVRGCLCAAGIFMMPSRKQCQEPKVLGTLQLFSSRLHEGGIRSMSQGQQQVSWPPRCT